MVENPLCAACSNEKAKKIHHLNKALLREVTPDPPQESLAPPPGAEGHYFKAIGPCPLYESSL